MEISFHQGTGNSLAAANGRYREVENLVFPGSDAAA